MSIAIIVIIIIIIIMVLLPCEPRFLLLMGSCASNSSDCGGERDEWLNEVRQWWVDGLGTGVGRGVEVC